MIKPKSSRAQYSFVDVRSNTLYYVTIDLIVDSAFCNLEDTTSNIVNESIRVINHEFDKSDNPDIIKSISLICSLLSFSDLIQVKWQVISNKPFLNT